MEFLPDDTKNKLPTPAFRYQYAQTKLLVWCSDTIYNFLLPVGIFMTFSILPAAISVTFVYTNVCNILKDLEEKSA